MNATRLTYTLLALTMAAFSAGGQTPRVDFSKIGIKTAKLAPNFYTLEGEGQGGTIAVLTGPDGILMVDSQYAPMLDKAVAAIRAFSNAPLRFVINTHVHADHTGGNEALAKMGVTIFAREELRKRLTGTVPEIALPVVTYSSPIKFHMDGEEVDVIPVNAAHTDGDTMVRFQVANVLMTGDFFRSVSYPNIDRANGGSLAGMIAGLGAAIKLCNPQTKVVPGHGAIADKAGLTAHRDMIVAVRDRVAKLIQEGKTADEVSAAHVTADYDAVVPEATARVPGGGGTSNNRFVLQVYAELKGGK